MLCVCVVCVCGCGCGVGVCVCVGVWVYVWLELVRILCSSLMLLGTNMCNGHVNGVKLFTEASDFS